MTFHKSSGNDWSQPETAVLRSITDAVAEQQDGVVATIVSVEGSAYRRPGAKMLIDSDRSIGSITAGCLEDDVVRLASDVLDSERPRLERFDLTDDDDWGLGLGCNGIIDLFLEPLDDRFTPRSESYISGKDGVSLAVIDSDDADVRIGARGFAPAGDLAEIDGLPGWLVNGVADSVSDLFKSGQSEVVSVTRNGSTVDVFVDSVLTPPDLHIFGSGSDVRPVAQLARDAGFRVTVVPFRGGRADPDTFPSAHRVVSTTPPRIAESLDIDEETYAAVMSHNFIDDRLAIESLLATPTPYIGLMGPNERFEDMRDAFSNEGRDLTETELDRIYTPIGLDLGGGEPYQIALSIITEVLAVHNRRNPRHLRDRKSPIHTRIETENA